MARRGLSIERLEVGELGANCYLLWCTRTLHALVVDPGAEAERILQAVARLKLVVKGIVDTHGHFDHCGANGPLRQATGAPLMIHEDDADLLAVQPETARAFGLRVPASPAPDRLLKDGDRLDVGDLTVEVIHTPGHSPGGICLRCDGTLLTGDTLFAGSVGRTDLPGGSHEALIAAIAGRLLTLGLNLAVLPGHGPSSTLADERRHNPFLCDCEP